MGGWELKWVVGWLGTKKFLIYIGYAVTRLRICYCMFNYTRFFMSRQEFRVTIRSVIQIINGTFLTSVKFFYGQVGI